MQTLCDRLWNLQAKLTLREPHSWDPRQQTTWSPVVTSDFNSVLLPEQMSGHHSTKQKKFQCNAMDTLSRKSLSHKSDVRQFSRNWVERGYLVAVTGSLWLLRGLHHDHFHENHCDDITGLNYVKVWPWHKYAIALHELYLRWPLCTWKCQSADKSHDRHVTSVSEGWC